MRQQLLLVVSFCSVAIGQRGWPTPPTRDSTADDGTQLKLSTTENSNVQAIEGFGTALHCRVNTCPGNKNLIGWFKDGQQIAEATRVLLDASKAHIEHNIYLNHSRDCAGSCSDRSPCQDGQHCLDGVCCFCTGEDFTLFLKNLTTADSGHYRCQVKDPTRSSLVQAGSSVDIDLETIESGLPQDFQKNLTYNYTDCCKRQGVKQECQGLCNIGNADVHRLDMNACEKDMPGFLNCATSGGNVSHLHCCRLQLVPPFCWDFCTGNPGADFRGTHRLCTYWIPEILECYEHAYLPFPGPPENVLVNTQNSHSLEVCWRPPDLRPNSITYYTVHYRELPQFPFLSGAPFLSRPEDQIGPPGQGPDEGFDHEVFSLEDITQAPLLNSPPPPPAGGGPFPFGEGRVRVDPRTKRTVRPTRLDDLSDEEIRQLDGSSLEGLHYRRKRQAWVFITHNSFTNETSMREFPFYEVNSTSNCATLDKLEPATQYFVYVTANNDYGTSLPSVRAMALTAPEVIPNGTLPDVATCCRKNNVSPICIPKICDLTHPPSALGALDIALNCRTEFSQVSPCLADGRNHTQCCMGKGVTGECLKLCSGTPAHLGIGAVVCLSVDMQAVYSCLRQGYGLHPSQPTNVTVYDISSRGAKIKWDPPTTLADKVVSFSVFHKEDKPDRVFVEAKNAISPHELISLVPNTAYLAYVVANSVNGSSLKSSVESFFTDPTVRSACRFGQPLRDPDGNVVPCYILGGTCPHGFECRVGRSETDSLCCPSAPSTEPKVPAAANNNMTECCANKGVGSDCMQLCSLNTTLHDLMADGPKCTKDITKWVDCGADGRDHRPCCIESGVSELCLEFCFPPIKKLHNGHISCLRFVDPIIKCARTGILKLPGPPIDFRLVTTTSNTVTFMWAKPLQDIPVEWYTVLVEDTTTQQVAVVNSTNLAANVTSLVPDHEYKATVVSHNRHGSSIPSANISFNMDAVGKDGDSKVKPEPPHGLEIVWQRDQMFNITWDHSGKSMAGTPLPNLSFIVTYGEQIMDKKIDTETVKTTEQWAVITVPPNKHFSVWVIAVNSADSLGVQSYASEVIQVFARPGTAAGNKPELTVTLSPVKNMYKEGEKVTITCTYPKPTDGTVEPDIVLQFGSVEKKGKGTVTYEVDKLTPEMNKQRKTCVVNTSKGTVPLQMIRMKVSYIPVVTTSLPDLNIIESNPARLLCQIKSFPQATVNWFFSRNQRDLSSGTRLSNNAELRYTILTESTWEEEKFVGSLEIIQTRKNDSGYYTCEVCNSVGCNRTQIHLKVDDYPVPQPSGSVQKCCRDKGVRKECQSACSFDIDISAYENNTDCFQEFPKLLQCAKDGFDHRQCCVRFGVSDDCLSLCNGQHMDTSSRESGEVSAKCAQFSRQIITCMEEKHDTSPGPPQNVKIFRLVSKKGTTGVVNVTWDPPVKNRELVELYVVYHREIGSGNEDAVWTNDRTKRQWKVIKNLNPDLSYQFYVGAGNHHSSFGFSTMKSVRLQELPVATPSGYGEGETDRSTKGGSSARSGAVAIGIIFVLLFIALVVLLGLYFRRKPDAFRRLPALFGSRSQRLPNAAVAFENPSYDRDAGQVRGLPEAPHSAATDSAEVDTDAGWHSAKLEPPEEEEPKQKGMKYTQLT